LLEAVYEPDIRLKQQIQETRRRNRQLRKNTNAEENERPA